MSKNIVLIFFFFLTTGHLVAQERIITGNVLDFENNEPLPGVSIVEKGTTNGVVSDVNGTFQLKTQKGATLVFSFIGMTSQEILIEDQLTLNIKLKTDVVSLDEMVVIGYGTQKKSHFSGAVAGISADKEKLDQLPVARLENALQGKLAGVQIRDKSSQAGEAPDIKIRGSASFNASNNPLLVVDGFPMVDGDLSDIEVTDVETLEVLKDAASTAIYGSRGANGVIMITTKMGTKNKNRFELKVSSGISNVYEYFDAYDRHGIASYYFNQEIQKWETPFLRLGESVPENPISPDGTPIENPNGKPYPTWDDWFSPTGGGDFYYQHNNLSNLAGATIWQEGITRQGKSNNISLSASGGTDKIQYYLSGSYRDMEGVLIDNEYNTVSFASKLDINLSDKVKIGINIRPQYQKKRNSDAAMANAIKQIELPSYHNEYSLAMGLGSTIRWKSPGDFAQASDFTNMYATDAEGNLILGENGKPIYIKTEYGTAAISPLSEALTKDDWTTFFKLTGNAFLDWKIAKGLNLKTSLGALFRQNEHDIYIMSYNISKGNNNAGNGSGSLTNSTRYSLVNENTISYKTKFNKHEFEMLAGFSVENYMDKYSKIEGNLFSNDKVRSMNQAGEISAEGTWSGKSDEALVSAFGRLQYNYQGKYLLSAVIRADGSSQFGPERRVGYFPSVSAGWRVSEEKFMQSAEWLTTLKLRATWGISGNNRIERYSYVTPINMRQYEFGATVQSGFAPSPRDIGAPRVLGNSNLGWEQTNETNIGFDIGLIKNRITLSLDIYSNLTTSLLLQDPLVTITGFESQWNNIGEIRNKGFELMFNAVPIDKTYFSWNSGINLTINRNHLVSYGDVQEQFFTGYKHQYVLRVNEPVSQYYGYVTDGIWRTQEELTKAQEAGLAQPSDVLGGVKIVDFNNDGAVNSEDQTTLGNPYPDFDWGFQNRFTYKKVDLTINFQGSHGFDVMQQSFWYGQKLGKWYLDDIYVDEFHGNKPIKTGSIIESDYYVEDGSYLALRDLILGVNLGSWKFLKNTRIYCSVHNLFYWWYKDYHGINPEYVESNPVEGVSGSIIYGEQMQTKPIARTIQFGLDVSF